ncbi:potassium channel family protein [Streptomyces sp. NBC_00094]|uniref:potassium channel family protein n=1 Tax=Streptomyces sp. NBC_00094 TaxID=2903620 RepID=UPI002253A9FA|nr:potassium channel family protein [Streptomyces sp. NBC_00094]MCX5390454.1 potassium channel family protein [Streptomyces sp. NBC_00094]
MPRMKDRWERRTQTPLLVLAVAFGIAYAVPIVAPDAAPWVHRLCTHVEWVVWAAFALDYVVRLALAPARWAFVRSHPLDLLAVLLPMVQPLRLLRVVSTLLLVGRRARMAPQITLTTYVAGAVVGLMMFGSLAVLHVERDAPNGNIKTLGDAVWWSFTTMTTVGYGDHAPTTGLGRVLAVGLMLSGIALLGVVTANIAAWFIARFDRDDAAERRQTELLETLTREVRELRTEVARLTAPAGSPDAPVPAGSSDALVPAGSPDAPAVAGSPDVPAAGSPDAPAAADIPAPAGTTNPVVPTAPRS